MKKFLLGLAATMLAGSMAVAQSQPATATSPNNPNATQTARTDVPADRNTDHNNNYSWLGLFGLLGLAGLAGRRDRARTYDADRTRTFEGDRADRVIRERDDIRRAG